MDLITKEELKEKLDLGHRFTLAMVMGDWAFRAKHIPGSINLHALEQITDSLPDKDEEIVVYCSGGACAASDYAYQILTESGTQMCVATPEESPSGRRPVTRSKERGRRMNVKGPRLRQDSHGISNLRGPLFLLAAAVLVMAAMVHAPSKVLAQADTCGLTRILVEGGSPSLFVLPAADGETLVVEPDAVLRIRVEEPPDDAKLRWKSGRLFGDLGSTTRDVGTAPIEIDVGSFSSYVRGLFEAEGTLLSGEREICSVTFELQIEGFAGVTAIASGGATAAAGLVSLAGVPGAANATAAKDNAQIRRRRREGWRRWLPVPAWRRTIFGFFSGAVTGIGGTILMQQAAINPLSLASAIWGAVIGGGVVVGLGYSLGAVRTFMQPPEEIGDEG
jgi:rhodanese-related sulfurtransferase